MLKFLKGLFGFCQVKGCKNRADCICEIKYDDKRVSKEKLCFNCAIKQLKDF